jgi:cell division protein ZapA
VSPANSLDEPVGVSIKILDKEYRIACPQDEQEGLMASARLLDQRMREIRQTGRVIGTDRIAVLAALNLAHELVQHQRDNAGEETTVSRRLARLQERVAESLSAEPHLDAPPERV